MSKVFIKKHKTTYFKFFHACYYFPRIFIYIWLITYPITEPLITNEIKTVVDKTGYFFDYHAPRIVFEFHRTPGCQRIDFCIGNGVETGPQY